MIELLKLEKERRGQSEFEVLGAMMCDRDGSVIDAVAESLPIEAISDDACREAFRVILECRRHGHPSTADIVGRKVDPTKCGTEDLIRMMEAVPYSANADYYARSAFEAYQLRVFSDHLSGTIETLRQPSSSVSDALRELSSKIERASKGGEAKAVASFGELLTQLTKAEDDYGVITTGIAALDALLKRGGFQPKQMVAVGARPSVGKTSFLTGLALAAAKAGYPALVLSFEMTELEIARRMVAQGQMRIDDEFDREMHGTLPIIIRDCSGWTMSRVESAVRSACRRDGVKLVVLDYLGLVATPSGRWRDNRNRSEIVKEMTVACKCLAMAETTVMVVAQQFNRASEDRASKLPALRDFKESGGLEEEADVAIGIHREIRPNQEEPIDRATVSVMKQRNGPTGDTSLSYDCERTLFKDLEVPTWRD